MIASFSLLEMPLITVLKHICQWLLSQDQLLFIKINTVWTNSFLDTVYPFWRDPYTWAPLYLFLVVFIFQNFGWKSWTWLAFFLLTFAITDQLSSHFIKYWVNRPRPCQDDLMGPYVRELLGRCPGNPSFPSSHATNHFGLAFFLYFTLKPYIKNWGYFFFFWAATISYGQIYVGVHYPSDVLGGAIIGSFVGWLTAFEYNRFIGLPPLLSEYKKLHT
jgi:membrane-associated phospholipid phosphatase